VGFQSVRDAAPVANGRQAGEAESLALPSPPVGFELGLRGTHLGHPRPTINPFTRKVEQHEPLVMSDPELQAALSVIARHGGTLNEQSDALDGRRVSEGHVKLVDARLEFSSFDAQGGWVEIFGMGVSAFEFLFEFATAGQLAIWNGSASENEPASVATTAEAMERAQAFEDELGTTALAENVGQLVSLLRPKKQ